MIEQINEWKRFLFNFCSRQDIDPLVFCSIIEIESGWNPSAIRYEPTFSYLEDPGKYCILMKTSLETEKALQRFSWGLCQIMGANVRALNYQGALTNLLDPALNLQYGVLFFKQRCGKYVYPEDQAAAWNYGMVKKLDNGTYINEAYVDKFNQSYKSALAALKHAAPFSDPLVSLRN